MYRAKYGLVIVLILILFILGFNCSRNIITYKEYTDISDKSDAIYTLVTPESELRQEFVMPYDLLSAISIKIGTYSRDNNSEWIVTIKKELESSVVYTWKFNGSQIEDNLYYVLKTNRPLRLVKGDSYIITIRSLNCTQASSLGFYGSSKDLYSDGTLFFNDNEVNADLTVRILGGDQDWFWSTYYCIFTALFLGIIIYCLYIRSRGKYPRENRYFQAICVGILYFTIMYIFTKSGVPIFTDEADNMRGGMIIAHGGILYRDYITQHTPFPYYLCALFAKMGASSFTQFRLLFNALCSIVWAALYLRNSLVFGLKKIILIPITYIFVLLSIIGEDIGRILGYTVQSLAMMALLLEYLSYLEDGKLDVKKAIIVSTSIYCCIASEFISIYAIAVIAAGVIINEIIKYKNSINSRIKSYFLFLAICILPFSLTIVYFYIHGTLEQLVEMTYSFNTQVYSNYIGGLGNHKIQPIIQGFKNYFDILPNFLSSLSQESNSFKYLIQLALIILVSIILIKQNDIPKACFFFCLICVTSIGGYKDFHGTAFWGVILVTVITQWNLELGIKIQTIYITIIILCVGQPYLTVLNNNMFKESDTITDWEHNVVERTQQNECIFIDTYKYDSLYLLYKNRYPINRLTYFLPWYLDWYEQDLIDDLNQYAPNILVYDPDSNVHGYTDFFSILKLNIKNNYYQPDNSLPVYEKK